jgi:hypothetical protein
MEGVWGEARVGGDDVGVDPHHNGLALLSGVALHVPEDVPNLLQRGA